MTVKVKKEVERNTHLGHKVILSPGFGGKPDPTDLYL